ncbi:MAG: hypothetical protein IPK15_19085 [Verrucomicrobia bacterium]|nr:hypothetical protein [Verrucomicrobiota bacterium]
MRPYTNTIPGTNVSFRMMPVRGGEFLLGSPAGKPRASRMKAPNAASASSPSDGRAKSPGTNTKPSLPRAPPLPLHHRGPRPHTNTLADAVAALHALSN